MQDSNQTEDVEIPLRQTDSSESKCSNIEDLTDVLNNWRTNFLSEGSGGVHYGHPAIRPNLEKLKEVPSCITEGQMEEQPSESAHLKQLELNLDESEEQEVDGQNLNSTWPLSASNIRGLPSPGSMGDNVFSESVPVLTRKKMHVPGQSKRRQSGGRLDFVYGIFVDIGSQMIT